MELKWLDCIPFGSADLCSVLTDYLGADPIQGVGAAEKHAPTTVAGCAITFRVVRAFSYLNTWDIIFGNGCWLNELVSQWFRCLNCIASIPHMLHFHFQNVKLALHFIFRGVSAFRFHPRVNFCISKFIWFWQRFRLREIYWHIKIKWSRLCLSDWGLHSSLALTLNFIAFFAQHTCIWWGEMGIIASFSGLLPTELRLKHLRNFVVLYFE